MGKKLAIKGHPTRGKEVIELLKMMGGNNKWFYDGSDGFVYFIEKDDKYITYCGKECIKNTGEYIIYELEEFLEKYPFKVGDKVIDEADGCPGVVSEMKWSEGLSDMKYCVTFGNGIDFGWYVNDSINFFKIKKNENLEETQSKREYNELRMPLDDDDKLATEATIMGKRILPPDGYLVGKITQTDNGMLVEYVEKKPKYPKTYKECCDVLGIDTMDNVVKGYKHFLIIQFQELLIACGAYWKIAGEELGLDRPWDSVYGYGEWGYWIGYDINANKIYCQDSRILLDHLLVFPSEEMRDAFYENFKDLIERCKALL